MIGWNADAAWSQNQRLGDILNLLHSINDRLGGGEGRDFATAPDSGLRMNPLGLAWLDDMMMAAEQEAPRSELDELLRDL